MNSTLWVSVKNKKNEPNLQFLIINYHTLKYAKKYYKNMGTIFSIEMAKFPIPPANEAYLESKKNVDLNDKLDQEIKNTSAMNHDRFNLLYSQTYEDCKARMMVAMLLGKTKTKCLDIGIDNERELIKLKYNLSDTLTHPYYLRVSWNPKNKN